MAARRTHPPNHYIQPSDKEIIDKAKLLGLKQFSLPLVRDVANIAAGGGYVGYEDMYSSIYSETTVRKDKDGNYLDVDTGQQIYNKNGDCVENYTEAVKTVATQKAEYNQNVVNFIQELDFRDAPGNTPLTKAVNIVNMVSKSQEHHAKQNGYPNPGSSQDEDSQIPIFSQDYRDQKGAEIGNQFNTAFDEMKRLDSEETELVTSQETEELLEEIEQNDELDNSEKRQLRKMALASEMTKGKDIWLQMSRRLESLINFRTRSFKKTIPSIEGESVRSRPIEHIGEINKLQSSEWANPKTLRLFRILSRKAQVRERVYTVDQKQLLYLLIDCSGSMHGNKIHKAGGVLMNRLKAVVKGEAELFVRFFDDGVYKEHSATTAEEAVTLMRHFEEYNFGGNGTDITKAVKKAKKDIDQKMADDELLVEPEIVVVTDGEDNGVRSLSAKDFLPSVVNGIMIQGENHELADFCRATRGVVIQNI